MKLFLNGVSKISFCVLILVVVSGSAFAQGTPIGINLGLSTWLNNCDVPAGSQITSLQPSFGPNFTLTYGKFRLGGTFYLGNFDIKPEDGIQRIFDSGNNVVGVEFIDADTRNRGFTSFGDTKRLDFTLNAGYTFSRYATLSLSFIVNRHEVDLITYWFPTADEDGNITNLPVDRAIPFSYDDTQYWIGQHFGGSVPIETVSTRFSLFYSAGLLVILGESGSSKVGTRELGPRVSYTLEEGGIAGPPAARDLGARPFGENVGLTFNTGVGFQLLERVGLYAGYNFKFFSEDETEFIDHSQFHGPFFGLNWNVQ